jgi:hypothetical protein
MQAYKTLWGQIVGLRRIHNAPQVNNLPLVGSASA